AFVNGDGTATAAQQIFTHQSGWGEGFSYPDVAWDGTRFLIVWSDSRSLSPFPCTPCSEDQTEALRVAADGTAFDTDATVIASPSTRAHVASSGHDFAIAVDAGSTVSALVAHASGPP